MSSYEPSAWSDFALAQLGASAALLGLVFVGISINLRELVGSSLLVNRAAETILVLASVLVAATSVLIPDQSREAVGIELLVIAVGTGGAIAALQRGAAAAVVAAGRRGPTHASLTARRLFGFGTAVLTGIAALSLLAEVGGGLYWWPAAVVMAYIGALFNAWVLMIEILR